MLETRDISTKSKIAVATFAIICLVTLVLSATMPIYVDETNWEMIKDRLFVDGYETTRISHAECIDGAAAAWPWFMVPFRAVDSLSYSGMQSPLFLRIVGIAYFVLIVIVLTLFCVKHLSSTVKPLTVALLVLSFLSVGTLPFLLTLNRPEQGLLLQVSILAFLPLVSSSENRNWSSSLIAAGLVAFISLCLFTTHPKGVFFLPVALVSGWFLVRPWSQRAVLLPAIVLFGGLSASHWTARIVCPNLPAGQAYLDAHSLSIALLSDPHKALSFFYASAEKGFGAFAYIRSILFQRTYMSDWLPPSYSLSAAGWIIDGAIVVTLIGLGLVGVIVFANLVRGARAEAKANKQIAVICALLVSLSVLAVVQVVKNAYESTLVIPLWGLLILIAIRGLRGESFQRKLGGALTLLVGLSVVSQANLWFTFGPVAVSNWSAGSFVVQQPTSVSVFDYPRLRQEIVSAAVLCGINAKERPRHLLVDELTYFSFHKSFRPILISNVTGSSFDLISYMSKMRSSGAIASCRSLPAGIDSSVRKSGEFCCVPATSQ